MRALLIANAADADAGFVGERFRHHGFAFSECFREYPDEWPHLDGHDLVLMLGSDWSVYWSQVADSVAREAALIRAAQLRGVAQFGICFGSQTMAHALGGGVEKATTPEIGWYDIDSDVPDAIASGPWLQWHYDAVMAPPDAQVLARTAVGTQAWQLGRSFSTQFHPEATETMLARWTSGAGRAELEAFGSSVERLMEETRGHVTASREHADRLVDWYLDGLS